MFKTSSTSTYFFNSFLMNYKFDFLGYIKREDLLKPLQLVSGAVEKRQTLPILSHVLLKIKNKQLENR